MAESETEEQQVQREGRRLPLPPEPEGFERFPKFDPLWPGSRLGSWLDPLDDSQLASVRERHRRADRERLTTMGLSEAELHLQLLHRLGLTEGEAFLLVEEVVAELRADYEARRSS